MERRQVEYFLAVIDHGGFTPAAAALHVSQPALSHAIKLLERDLGSALFYRLPRGVRLTVAGETFAGSARRIVREAEIARARVREVGGLIAGRLDLVALPALLMDPLAGAIGQFRARHPGVLARIVPAETPQEIRDAVRTGAAELGLTDELDPADRELVSDLIAEQEFAAVLPPGSARPPGGAITVRSLLGMDLVTGPPGTVVRDFLTREAGRLGQQFVPAVEVGLRGSALYLALAGAGAAVLPRPMAELGRPHSAVIVPLHPPQRHHVYLAHRTGPLSPAARVMRALLTPGRRPGEEPSTGPGMP